MRRYLGWLAWLTALLIVLPGSAGLAQTANSPYTIGVTFALTGPLAVDGPQYRAAVDFAVDDVNRAGGVKGHPLRVVYEDTQGTAQGGVTAMRKVVQVDGAQAVLTMWSDVVFAQVPLADQLKVPFLCPAETPGLMTRGQYSFAHAVLLSNVAPMLGNYWKAERYKRIFAFLVNSAQGQAFSAIIKAQAQAAGADYAEAFLNLGEADHRGSILRAREFNPDAIFINMYGSPAEAGVIKQTRELGIATRFFTSSNFFTIKSWRDAVGSYADGMIFGGLNFSNTAPTRAFTAAYRAKTGTDPSYVSGELYDIVKMFAAAIGNSSYDAEAIKNALVTLKGVPSVFGGTISMGRERVTDPAALALWQAKGDTLVKIEQR